TTTRTISAARSARASASGSCCGTTAATAASRTAHPAARSPADENRGRKSGSDPIFPTKLGSKLGSDPFFRIGVRPPSELGSELGSDPFFRRRALTRRNCGQQRPASRVRPYALASACIARERHDAQGGRGATYGRLGERARQDAEPAAHMDVLVAVPKTAIRCAAPHHRRQSFTSNASRYLKGL